MLLINKPEGNFSFYPVLTLVSNIMAAIQAKKEQNRTMQDIRNKDEVLEDYRLAVMSRECSLLGRREALTGKAKFGIFGDGKELPQLVLAKYFKDGDFRAGYYRDQTIMFAIGELTVRQFFAQLYAHTDVEKEPHSGGRQMNAHFSTRSLNKDGSWKNLSKQKNTSPDISPTAGQMARLVGLAQASKVYRHNELLDEDSKFSDNGNEIAFGTIGDASTSEGVFWEAVNAMGVLQVPVVLSVWDDGYGISVPKKYQTTKESISEILKGFQRTENQDGYEIIRVKAYDYEGLHQAYSKAEKLARKNHIPVLVHVTDVTQPQGHSTSGSHERYKSEERLKWEKEHCCNIQFRNWILDHEIATASELDNIEDEAKKYVRSEKREALDAYTKVLKNEGNKALKLIEQLKLASGVEELEDICDNLKSVLSNPVPYRKNTLELAKKAVRVTIGHNSQERRALINWLESEREANNERYSSHLYSQTEFSPIHLQEIPPEYDENAKEVDGRVVLRDNFEKLFEEYPETLVFGEDSGRLGDVNLGLEGMQDKFGELRVSDTGIREATILGQGIGMALRGLRPIAEIQYLDYLFYCFQVMSDDLATIHYRSKGGQKAPVIVRTRGHRLEGIWHSGSPMAVCLNGFRGIHICVPRNLTQAAGMYNTLLQGDDPALVVEPLNGYRLKELMPSNLGTFRVPLGIPEIVSEGTDVTMVSYGSTFNICADVVKELKEFNISVELIDVRTLLPFDRKGIIGKSLQKTNRILFVDEDMPGGTTAYMMQKVLEEQNGYFFLDSQPVALSARAHRPAYGTDGDYFSKPNYSDIFEAVYNLMHEANPVKYPGLYS